MNDNLKQIISHYDFNAISIDSLNDYNDVFKVMDDKENVYFLKVFKRNVQFDIVPGENVFHTYEQILLESEILHRLSNSAVKTAIPIKNKVGEFLTILSPETNDESYATLTSFVEGMTYKHEQIPTLEIAYSTGIAAAQLHLESEKTLLSVAVKRPHKKQDYINKIRERLAQGIKIETLTAVQYEMLSQCCDVVINCMNQLDKDPDYNVGLVHTDIQSSNIIFAQNQTTLIDYSRSVYSYYLYDLGHMCLHGGFGGSSKDLQKAILRGYHSVKPLIKDHPFMMQAMFSMFILHLIAGGIESKQNTWLTGVLKWFTDEVHPGLLSGEGYLDSSVFENISTV